MSKEYKLVKLYEDYTTTEVFREWLDDRAGEPPKLYDIPKVVKVTVKDIWGKPIIDQSGAPKEREVPNSQFFQSEFDASFQKYMDYYNRKREIADSEEFLEAVRKGEISKEAIDLSCRISTEIQSLSRDGWSFIQLESVPEVSGRGIRINPINTTVGVETIGMSVATLPKTSGGEGSGGETETHVAHFLFFERELEVSTKTC